MGSPPLELPLRHEQREPGFGAGEGPLLPVADQAVSREHLLDPLGEGAREQLHVQLAKGYGPVVVLLGEAQDLWAEPNVRSLQWVAVGAKEDGLIGVDKEPLEGCWDGLNGAGLYVFGARGLEIGLVQSGLQVSHGVLLDLDPSPFQNLGHVAAEDRLGAGEVHRALVVQLPPEGADRGHQIIGLRQERLSVGDPHVSEARRARGFHLDCPSHGLPLQDYVRSVAAPEVLDGALAVRRQDRAENADVFL